MTIKKKPAAFQRDGLSNKVLPTSNEPDFNIPSSVQIQHRARDLFVEALGLRGGDRHAALSLSRHFDQLARRVA